VLLAAGEGTRLYPYTHERPKCLVEVGGRPLLDRALAALEQAGVDEVVIVTGYREDVLAAWLAQRPHRLKVTLVRNELYASTNNAYSLWTARVAVPGAFVLLDGDLLFETRVLTTLLAASGEAALAVERRRELGDEEMKVIEAADGTVAAVSKTVEVAQAIGESVGLARFSAAGCPAVVGPAGRSDRGRTDPRVLRAGVRAADRRWARVPHQRCHRAVVHGDRHARRPRGRPWPGRRHRPPRRRSPLRSAPSFRKPP
jgi:choline kinase